MIESSNMAKAKTYIKSGNYKKAEYILGQAISTGESEATSYFELGNIYHLKGEIGRAIRSYKKVLEIDPSHTDASISLSVLLNDVGQYDEARKIFESTDKRVKQGKSGSLIEDTHINKKFAAKHLELAELYLTYNRFDEALFEIKKSCALDVSNYDLRLKLAKIYAKKGFKGKAIDELTKIKNESPEYLPARNSLGVIYFGGGNVIEAQAEWEKVLSINPKDKEARTYLDLSKNANEVSLS